MEEIDRQWMAWCGTDGLWVGEFGKHAEQRKAEAAGDDIEGMRRAIEDFRAALDRALNRLVSIKEVSEGLAAALQVLGLKNEDEHQARDAVQLFREVVEHA